MLHSLFCCFHKSQPLKFEEEEDDEETQPFLCYRSERTRWDRRWGPKGRGSSRKKRYVEFPSPAFSRLDDEEPGILARVKRIFSLHPAF
jgi:hypothetical protein